MSSRDDENPADKIKRLIQEASSNSSNVTDFFAAARKRGKDIEPPALAPKVRISGNSNTSVVGNNNHIEINLQPKIDRRPQEKLQPGPNNISDAQAAEIKELVGKVVAVSGREYPFVWSTVKRKYRFTTYQLITHDKYEDIREYLRKWIASATGSSKTTAEDDRKRFLKRIHAEARKQKGLLEKVHGYIQGRFGTSSLAELTPGQLNEVIHYFRF